jgi:hypothetical protein
MFLTFHGSLSDLFPCTQFDVDSERPFPRRRGFGQFARVYGEPCSRGQLQIQASEKIEALARARTAPHLP